MDLQAAADAKDGLVRMLDIVQRFFTLGGLERAIKVALILVVGLALVRITLIATKRISRKRFGPRAVDVLEKTVKYGGTVFVLINAARAAGIDVSAVLGAAGIAGIAIGFAAQTSISNIISGLFLFSEKAYEVGDVVQTDSVLGTVESIDMLAVRLRTFDNRLVRVPNETMIKSNIINVTHWPTRRLDLSLTLPYGTDLAWAERALRGAAASMPLALSEPEPFFMVDSLGPNGVSLQFGVWFKKDDFLKLKNALLPALLAEFEKAGIRPAAQVVGILAPPPPPPASPPPSPPPPPPPPAPPRRRATRP